MREQLKVHFLYIILNTPITFTSDLFVLELYRVSAILQREKYALFQTERESTI